MKKKSLTKVMTTAALMSALSLPASAAAATLSDINGSFAKDAILELAEKGIINGKGDGKFDPTGNISRQDFAIILAKAMNLDLSTAPATATFSDVPSSHYAFAAVEAAVKAGLIKGTGNGEFGFGQNLSRQDMAVLFVRALGQEAFAAGKGSGLKFSDAHQISDYAKDAVAAAVELRLLNGTPNGMFNPTGSAERQQVALVASKFLKKSDELKNQTPATPSPEGTKNPPPAQPQTPEAPKPQAPVSTSGGSNSGGSSGGGTTNPDPVTTEMAQPTVSFADGKTLVLAYGETLDSRYVPAAEDFQITRSLEGQTSPVGLKSIQIKDKSVILTTDTILPLDQSAQLTYRSLSSERTIRGASGKVSPAISAKNVTYTVADPSAVLRGLVDKANALLDGAYGKYPAYEIQHLWTAAQEADAELRGPVTRPEMVKNYVYTLQVVIDRFESSKFQPLTATLNPEVPFVLNPGIMGMEYSIDLADDNVIGNGPATYKLRNINDFLKVSRGTDSTIANLVFDEAADSGHFKIIIDDFTVGSVKIESTDPNIQISKESDRVKLRLLAADTVTQPSLRFKIYETGNTEPVQVLELPMTLDNTPPAFSVTESTYGDGVITLVADEPIWGPDPYVTLQYIPDSLNEGGFAGHPVPFDRVNDFTHNYPAGGNRLILTLTENGNAKVSNLASGKFIIGVSGITDFAKNGKNTYTIEIPVLSFPPRIYN